MDHAFLVCGYGVPKEISDDENYSTYLHTVFNTVFDIVNKEGAKRPLIVCSGGKTDMFSPYRRSEGAEMERMLKSIARRAFVKKIQQPGNLFLRLNHCLRWKICFISEMYYTKEDEKKYGSIFFVKKREKNGFSS